MTDPMSAAGLAAVQARIVQLAGQAGIDDAGHGSVDETLAALPLDPQLDETPDPNLVEVWSDRQAVRLKDTG